MSDTPPPLTPGPPHQSGLPGMGPPPDSGSGRKTAACCGIGCLSLIVLSLVLVIVGIRFGKNKLGEWAETYTSDQAVELVLPQIDPAGIDLAANRYETFKAAMGDGSAGEPLVLSEEGLNALLLHHPDFSGLSKSAVATIENDLLSINSSFDLDSIQIPFDFIAERVKGKYFNGEVTVRLDSVAGRPAIYLENVAVGDREIPQVVIDSLRSENLLKDIDTNPEMKKAFGKIKELKIENNQLIVVPASAP